MKPVICVHIAMYFWDTAQSSAFIELGYSCAINSAYSRTPKVLDHAVFDIFTAAQLKMLFLWDMMWVIGFRCFEGMLWPQLQGSKVLSRINYLFNVHHFPEEQTPDLHYIPFLTDFQLTSILSTCYEHSYSFYTN
jgi:hypothetical protein